MIAVNIDGVDVSFDPQNYKICQLVDQMGHQYTGRKYTMTARYRGKEEVGTLAVDERLFAIVGNEEAFLASEARPVAKKLASKVIGARK